MAEISRQPRPGGRVAQSTTEATANADGEPAGTAASYIADGENVPGGAATIASRASTIAFDGSAGTGELLPGPADLLAAALAACILKNVERFSGLLPFRYQHARVHVEIERQEPPPRIVRARYTLRIITDEPEHRLRAAAPQHPALRHHHQHPRRRLRARRHDPRRAAQPLNRSSNEHPDTPTSADPSRTHLPRRSCAAFIPAGSRAVMGTGIVGVAAYLNPGDQPGLRHTAHTVGVAFVLLAWLLAIAIAIPYLARLVRHRDAATADLRHPIIGALYATLPAAILVLAVATATVGGSLLPAHTVVADRGRARRDRRAARVRRRRPVRLRALHQRRCRRPTPPTAAGSSRPSSRSSSRWR